MGRGRAKAKQTKVARELKYSSPTMDIDALQRELGSGGMTLHDVEDSDHADYDDPYDPYAPDGDEERSSSHRRY
ncbi:MAG TPA: DUF3073 domain-containing protein [Pseudonocardia sp.]|jgi:Protein of unknown function (DUF3073)|nr:DUF3073 domain-containing protein [Pseudonocardia sp.]